MDLTSAIQQADLPSILEREFPTCGARAGRPGRVRCTWRDGTAWNGNLYLRAGRWRLHDFSTNEDFDAFDVLTRLVGLSPKLAALELVRGQSNSSKRRTRTRSRFNLNEFNPPEFPDGLLGWLWATKRLGIPLWNAERPRSTTDGALTLELLADWLADSLRPAFVEAGYLQARVEQKEPR